MGGVNMERNKNYTPILIGLVCLVLFIIVIAAVVLLMSNKNVEKNTAKGSNKEKIQPTIELSLESEEENQEKVNIQVSATTEDEGGIEFIILPNGNRVYMDNAEYEATENGKYTFKAVGINGGEKSSTIEVKNIRENSAYTPYIPEGFEYVGGEVDTGYVIQDQFGNQFVWVPVPSKLLTRTTLTSTEYEETSNSVTDLANSVAKYFGFYISRFEASEYTRDGEKVAASIADKVPWTNVTFQTALDASAKSSNAFEYSDCQTALVNSFAWDTALEWMSNSVPNYSSNTSFGNYSGTILSTGQTESDRVNNICDMAGNVREWTTEVYKGGNTTSSNGLKTINRVVRGGSAILNKIASSRNGYEETLTDEYWGFRYILFRSI